MRRPTDAGESIESFREAVLDAASSSSHSSFLVTSFDRASLGQTGASSRSASAPRPHARAHQRLRARQPSAVPRVAVCARTFARRQLALASRCRTQPVLAHALATHDRLPASPPLPQPMRHAGGGHFSPIGGYHAPSDAALVLDVARFKYPPYWVPLRRLWDASLVEDEVTGRSRGWFHLSRNVDVAPPRGA